MKLVVPVAFAIAISSHAHTNQESLSPTERTAKIRGVTLVYVEHGRGSPVLFLHGAFSDHRVWESQREAVAPKYRFIALSMRYFGTAPWPDNGEHFSQATHIADIAAFIRRLQAGPIVVVGRSYGATTALALAIHHPELVRGLFLNEPGVVSAVVDDADRKMVAEDQAGIDAVTTAVKAGDNAEAARQFFDWLAGIPGSFDSLTTAERTIHLDNARTIPLQSNPKVRLPITRSQLGGIKVPVIITRGELTRPYFRVTSEAVSRCIPGSQLIIVPDARHQAPGQNPSAFNEALLSFLARGSNAP